MQEENPNFKQVLTEGGVAVMPTDTIYGIVGRAENKSTVERIYEIRKRAPEKPCIILISDTADLSRFSIELTQAQKEKIREFWPGPVSIILDCLDDDFKYLHRGTNTLAFRIPAQEDLRELLAQTGPLVAPSANPEGLPPAVNIPEARAYFGEAVLAYVDGGEIRGTPSRVIKLHKDGSVTILRP